MPNISSRHFFTIALLMALWPISTSADGAVEQEMRQNQSVVLTVFSQVLGEERAVFVQLPPTYSKSNKHYPVLLVLDGEWLFDLASAHARYYAFDEVTDERIPEMIVVGIPNTDRDRDYTPTTNSGKAESFPAAGGADRFLDFLETELLPTLDRNYRTVPSRTVVGWSFSGLFAAYASLERPTLFNAYLCISPAVWWDNDLIYRRLQQKEVAMPDRMVFTLGTKESGGWVYESTKRLVDYMRNSPDVDTEPDLFDIEGVGHTWGVAEAIDRGLISLFSEYVAPESTISGGMQEIGEYYNRLSESWAYQVTPPNKVLHGASLAAWKAGDSGRAIDILLQAATNNPSYSPTRYLLGKLNEELGETVSARKAYQDAIEIERRKETPNLATIRAARDGIIRLSEHSE